LHFKRGFFWSSNMQGSWLLILVKSTEIRLYLQFSDSSGTERNSVWFKINRKICLCVATGWLFSTGGWRELFHFNSNRDHTFSALNWKNVPKSDVIRPPETSRTLQNCDIKELEGGPYYTEKCRTLHFFQFRCPEAILFEIRLMFHPIFYKKKCFWNGGNRIFGYPNQTWNLHNLFITPSVFVTVEIVFLDCRC